jgi:hypothetical protein
MKIVVRLMAFTADDNRHRCALTSTNQCETRRDLEFSVGFDRRCRKGKEGRAVGHLISSGNNRAPAHQGNGRLMRFYAKKARL